MSLTSIFFFQKLIKLRLCFSCFLRLREEIDQIFGSREIIKEHDLLELKYTNFVIKETLRKWSVAPDLNRTVTSNDFHIKSFHIPKGTLIQVSSYVCSTAEQYFPNHKKFQPERFLNENE
jgi:cytochrome P450